MDEMPQEDTSLFRAIAQITGHHVAYSNMAYSARAAGQELARNMGIPEGSPILNLEQFMLLDDGRPVEWSDTMLGSGHTIVGVARQTGEIDIALGENLF